MNPDNPLGRHTGEGRYPAITITPRSGQNQGIAPLTNIVEHHQELLEDWQLAQQRKPLKPISPLE